MADKTGYIGRNPADSSVIIARQTFEPSGGTSDFTFTSGYTVGLVDVFINGSKSMFINVCFYLEIHFVCIFALFSKVIVRKYNIIFLLNYLDIVLFFKAFL